MFDIGFSEIVVIGVVALVVIGPERLPKTARTVGLLFGRLQRYVNDVKADISREMELDELRRLQSEMQGAARDLESTVKGAANDMAAGVRSVESELNAAASQATETGGTAVSSPPLPVAAAGIDAAPPLPVSSAGTEAPPPRQAPLPGFDKI
ncbi:MAG TPA: Sec-independent protein translocase protein TatB [Casimicrobiaceae bacterium]|nr:Sec-independent protein translocase protein TatB [Casimicrobiaceae bacterium]